MTRFVLGDDRSQNTLFPERLDDYLGDDDPVRAVDVFVEELDLAGLGFGGIEPEATRRPAYHPATSFKIYVYGSIACSQAGVWSGSASATSNCWLTGRLMPDFKTIAEFRKDNGEAIRKLGEPPLCQYLRRRSSNRCGVSNDTPLRARDKAGAALYDQRKGGLWR